VRITSPEGHPTACDLQEVPGSELALEVVEETVLRVNAKGLLYCDHYGFASIALHVNKHPVAVTGEWRGSSEGWAFWVGSPRAGGNSWTTFDSHWVMKLAPGKHVLSFHGRTSQERPAGMRLAELFDFTYTATATPSNGFSFSPDRGAIPPATAHTVGK